MTTPTPESVRDAVEEAAAGARVRRAIASLPYAASIPTPWTLGGGVPTLDDVAAFLDRFGETLRRHAADDVERDRELDRAREDLRAIARVGKILRGDS